MKIGYKLITAIIAVLVIACVIVTLIANANKKVKAEYILN